MADSPPDRLVLDASALLAYLFGETGGEGVRAAVPVSLISSLNWSEVIQKSLDSGVDIDGMRGDVLQMGLLVVPFEARDAEEAALLWPRARSVSLADRACLALARRLAVPALTADRAWQTLDLGVEVRLIR
jgi:ribonuclease VapC